MNKEEILKKIKQSNLNKERIIILSGASLLVQGIIESTKATDFLM